MRWEYELLSPDHQNPGPDSAAYFRRRFASAENDNLKARYGKHLWIIEHDNNVALATQEALNRLISIHSVRGWAQDDDSDHLLPDLIRDFVTLAVERHNKHELKCAQDHLGRIMDDLRRDKKEIRVIYILEPMIPFLHQLDQPFVTGLIQELLTVSKRYEGDMSGLVTMRRLLEIVAAAQHKLGLTKEARTTRLQMFQSHIDEGDLRLKENSPNCGLGAVISYKNALQMSADLGLGNDTPIVKDIHSKLASASDQIQYHGIAMSATVDLRPLQPLLDALLKLPAKEILIFLGSQPFLKPDLQSAKKAAEEQGKVSVLSGLIPQTILSGDRLVGEVEPGLEGEEHSVRKNLLHRINMITIILHSIISRCLLEKQLAVNDFVGRIEEQGIFDLDHLPAIRVGLQHILDTKDFISGISVLMPQIEHYLRCCLKAHGETTVRRKRDGGGQQEMSIGELISNDRTAALFGEGTRTALDVLLNDELQDGMRHHVAHGMYGEKDFTEVRAFMLVFVLLQMMAISKPNQNPAGPV